MVVYRRFNKSRVSLIRGNIDELQKYKIRYNIDEYKNKEVFLSSRNVQPTRVRKLNLSGVEFRTDIGGFCVPVSGPLIVYWRYS